MVKVRYRGVSKDLEEMASPLINVNRGRSSFGTPNIRECINIPIDSLLSYHKQARHFFDEESLKELAESIKNFGIRQPLSVIRKKDKSAEFEVISGERRLKAPKMIGLQTVPCIIIDDTQNAEFVAIIENIQRENLHPIELACGLNSLTEKGNFDNFNDLWKQIGISKSKAYEALGLLKLPLEIQDKLVDLNIKDRKYLRSLLKSKNPVELLENVIQKSNHGDDTIKKLESTYNILSIKNNNFIIKKSYISNLSHTEKKRLKETLEVLIKLL
jgi:ParB family chromosome partitioning protein